MANSIEGVLLRIAYHKPDKYHPSASMFLIGYLDSGDTVKGHMEYPAEGERYRFWGDYRDQKGYVNPAFVFTTCEVIIDQTVDGVSEYLRRHIVGLGEVKSRKIVEHLGNDTFTILRQEPDRIAQVPGITPQIIESIAKHFAGLSRHVNPAEEAELYEMFEGYKFSQKTIQAILHHRPNGAPRFIREHPYALMGFSNVGWKKTDSFALTKLKYDASHIERHAAAIVEAFLVLSRQGHTCATYGMIDKEIRPLIGTSARPEAWIFVSQASEDRVIPYQLGQDGIRYLALAKFANAEVTIANQIKHLTQMAMSIPFELNLYDLSEEQIRAIRLVENHGVCIVTGAPGTGKSYTMGRLIAGLIDGGYQPEEILYLAPTGKAAKRGKELLSHHLPPGVEVGCLTIHRALSPKAASDDRGVTSKDAKMGRGRDSTSFSRNEAKPIKARIVIADEFSMTDVRLAASLLRAIASGTRLIIVGDENQLPSVGPGAVLRDLMKAGIPTVTLHEIRRSELAGHVVHACHAIKDGRIPQPADVACLPTENWVHIELDDPEEIAKTIVNLHGISPNFEPIWRMQVVSPQKDRFPFACFPLNSMLAPKLNPIAARIIEEREISGDHEYSALPPFFIGDKVVRTENGPCDRMVETGVRLADEDDDVDIHHVDWHWKNKPYRFVETLIVNGDMGSVLDIVDSAKDTSVVVQFRNPDRLVRLSFKDSKLLQAYAMTAHKCQGSGFPFVIVPVHNAFYAGLFNREWIYTAISRAEEMLVTVGQFSAIRAAIGRKTVHLRKTKLQDLLEDFRAITQEHIARIKSSSALPTNSTMVALNPLEPKAITHVRSADHSAA